MNLQAMFQVEDKSGFATYCREALVHHGIDDENYKERLPEMAKKLARRLGCRTRVVVQDWEMDPKNKKTGIDEVLGPYEVA